MAGQMVTTECLVVAEWPHGEAAKRLSLFTRELGLVQVIAKGIRFQKSKLRYHTQLYSFARVTLVPGKEHWVLTGALPLANADEQDILLALRARAAFLLQRFLGVEDPHPEIYDDLTLLAEQGNESDIDIVLQLRILDRLGYVSHSPATRSEALFLIEQAHRESHL